MPFPLAFQVECLNHLFLFSCFLINIFRTTDFLLALGLLEIQFPLMTLLLFDTWWLIRTLWYLLSSYDKYQNKRTDFCCSQMIFHQVRELPIHKCGGPISMRKDMRCKWGETFSHCPTGESKIISWSGFLLGKYFLLFSIWAENGMSSKMLSFKMMYLHIKEEIKSNLFFF